MSEPTEFISSKKVVNNILSLGAGEILARVTAFIGTAYLARKLEPTGFGIVNFAAALFGYFALMVTAGFNEVGAREIARHPKKAASIAISVTLFRSVLAFIALSAMAAVTVLLDKPPEVKAVLFLTGLLFIPLALDTSWVYKGLERNGRVGLVLVLGQILYVAAVLLSVKLPEDVRYVPVSQFFGEMAAALLLIAPVIFSDKIKLDLSDGIRIFRNSGAWAFSRLLRTLIFTFDVVLIGFMLNERDVGLYTAPYRICFLLVALAVAIYASYLPAMIRANMQGKIQVENIAGRSLSLSSAIAAPAAIGGIILAIPILQTVFGANYVEGAVAFRFLILSVGFIFISQALHNVFLVFDKLKTEMMIIAAAAALNIGLNIILIPELGLTGAGIATASAEALILSLGIFAIFRFGVRIRLYSLLRPLAAAGLMGGFLFVFGQDWPLLASLLAGLIIYILFLILLRGVPDDAKPHIQIIFMPVRKLAEQFRRAWHFWTGPTREEIAEAKIALSNREYYHLYENRYNEIKHSAKLCKSRIHESEHLVQQTFEHVVAEGIIAAPPSRLLDLGCGLGQNSIYFAQRGYKVTGVDIAPTAVEIAASQADSKKLNIDFRVADVLELADFPENSFNLAADIGCLHMLVRHEHRERYLNSVRRVLAPGSSFFLFNRVSLLDVRITDEDWHLLKHVTLIEKRFLKKDNSSFVFRNPGFRNASLSQYVQELESAGFEIVYSHRIWEKFSPFWIALVAKVPD